MLKTKFPRHLLSASAAMAMAAIPAALSAQPGERISSVPAYHLVQVSVARDNISEGEFIERSKSIRSCSQAVELGEEIGARVTRDRFVRAGQLPPYIRDLLAELPVGHATEVYGIDGEPMRVLVLCARL